MVTELEEKLTTESTQSNGFKNNQLIVFKLGDEEYGLLIGQIKEVVITPHITKVPLTPSFIRGVANVRGNILAILDLEERLGLVKPENSAEKDKANFTLVVENEEYKMGILVREVPNTLAISNNDIDQSPSLIHDHTLDKNYIKGIVKSNGRLIILVDVYKIISREDISSALSPIKS